jgi:transposase-like protein
MKRDSKKKSELKIAERYECFRYNFSEEEKLSIVKDYLSSGENKQRIWQKYTGESKEHGRILEWMQKFGYKEAAVVEKRIFADNKKRMKKEGKPIITAVEFENLQLKKRIVELEKQVRESDLRAIAFSTMIDIAERELKISIKKKSTPSH